MRLKEYPRLDLVDPFKLGFMMFYSQSLLYLYLKPFPTYPATISTQNRLARKTTPPPRCQVLRSKEMLLQQTQREELETQRFQLEESMKGLRWKESSDPTRRSTARGTFRGSAEETDRNRDKHGKATGKHRFRGGKN